MEGEVLRVAAAKPTRFDTWVPDSGNEHEVVTQFRFQQRKEDLLVEMERLLGVLFFLGSRILTEA